MGLADRGRLEPGRFADILIYDLEQIGYKAGQYDVVDDLPGGDWGYVGHAQGIRYIFVNGVETYQGGEPTGNIPGARCRPSLLTPICLRD